jgi:hypothetical protein
LLPAQRGFPSPWATDRDAATAVAAMGLELRRLLWGVCGCVMAGAPGWGRGTQICR